MILLSLDCTDGIDLEVWRSEARSKGISIYPFAEQILTTILQEESSKGVVEVVVLTVADLGLSNGSTRHDVHREAFARGLTLCPKDLALRFQSHYNPLKGEWIIVESKPTLCLDGDRHRAYVFNVGHALYGGPTLGVSEGGSGVIYSAGVQFLFIKTRS